MSSRNSEVSVVILTRNSEKTLENCLRSVNEEEPGEILAVDNMSTDRTLSILEGYGIRVIVDRQGSLGYSRRVGVEASHGRYIMFVDSDVELEHGCIQALRNDLEKFGWTGVHAGFVSRECQSYWQRAQTELLTHNFRTAGTKNQLGTIAALFRRDVLLKIPFDSNFAAAAEDKDISERLVRQGFQLGVSQGVAYHYYDPELVRFVKRRFRYGLGDAQFALKYKSIRKFAEALTLPFLIVYIVRKRRIGLIPFWWVATLAASLGMLVGLYRARRISICQSSVVAEKRSLHSKRNTSMRPYRHRRDLRQIEPSDRHRTPFTSSKNS